MTTMRPSWQNLAADRLDADAGLSAAWDHLNASRLDLPFMASHAVSSALQCFGTGNERLLVGRRGTDIAAMLVVQRCGVGRWQTFQPSQLPLGAWVALPSWPLPELAEAVLREALGACLVFSVTQVDPRGAPRPADGPATTVGDYIDTAWIDVAGSFDDYWARRGKNLRANMRKQRNKLAAEGVHAEMRTYMEAADMPAALARYGALESSGWKAGEGTAIHAGNAQGRFYTALLEQAAARGEARVYEYLFDDRTVAMHLGLQRGAELVILKTSYDERVDKSLSPAFLLHQDELQLFFPTHQLRRVEYYGRLMEWHTRWTEQRRTLYHLTRYRWAWLKWLKRRASRGARAEAVTAPAPATLA